MHVLSPTGSHPKAAPLERTSNLGRAVVQPGRTLAWGARGREFESRQPDHGLRQPHERAKRCGLTNWALPGCIEPIIADATPTRFSAPCGKRGASRESTVALTATMDGLEAMIAGTALLSEHPSPSVVHSLDHGFANEGEKKRYPSQPCFAPHAKSQSTFG